MIRADFDHFAAAFDRLTLALPNRTRDDVRGEQMAASKVLYFEQLEDVPIEAVVAGADDILETETFFPVPAEWRRAALKAKYRFALAALPSDAPGDHVCKVCEDTGFVRRVCRVGERCSAKHVDRPETFEHSYTTPCPCREANVAYQRERALTFGVPEREIGRDEAKQLLAHVETVVRDPHVAAAGRDVE